MWVREEAGKKEGEVAGKKEGEVAGKKSILHTIRMFFIRKGRENW
jgi:hypothetical protein